MCVSFASTRSHVNPIECVCVCACVFVCACVCVCVRACSVSQSTLNPPYSNAHTQISLSFSSCFSDPHCRWCSHTVHCQPQEPLDQQGNQGHLPRFHRPPGTLLLSFAPSLCSFPFSSFFSFLLLLPKHMHTHTNCTLPFVVSSHMLNPIAGHFPQRGCHRVWHQDGWWRVPQEGWIRAPRAPCLWLC